MSRHVLTQLGLAAALATLVAGCGGGGSAASIPVASRDAAPVAAAPVSGSAAAVNPGKSSPSTPSNPSVTSTPPPVAAASVALSNAVEWPASFRPYGPTSIWNKALPANPTLYPNSDAIVSVAEQNDPGPTLRTQEYGNDVSHPVVFASNSDPVVTAHCTLYCGNVQDYQLHIPAKARPAAGPDHHLAVIQPDGTEDDFWELQSSGNDWQSGQTLTYQGGVQCGNFYNGPGWAKDAATAGNACLAGGLIRAAEVQSGTINHALFLVLSCTDPNAFVFPATNGGAHCTGAGPNVPNGARIWLDVPDATIAAMGLPAWQKAILTAMHDYGGYVMDVGGSNTTKATGLMNVMFEDNASYAAFGQSSPMDQFAQSNGWNPVSVGGATRYIAQPDPWNPGINWAQHLHIVDPCYGQGTC